LKGHYDLNLSSNLAGLMALPRALKSSTLLEREIGAQEKKA
jgi:hypothetical protein